MEYPMMVLPMGGRGSGEAVVSTANPHKVSGDEEDEEEVTAAVVMPAEENEGKGRTQISESGDRKEPSNIAPNGTREGEEGGDRDAESDPKSAEECVAKVV